jgi:hypothetical protein
MFFLLRFAGPAVVYRRLWLQLLIMQFAVFTTVSSFHHLFFFSKLLSVSPAFGRQEKSRFY